MANQAPYNAIPYRRIFRWFLYVTVNTLALFFLPQNAIAETPYLSISNSFNNGISNQSPVNFSLSFSNADLNLETDNDIYPVVQDRISVTLVNKISANLNIGLILGSNFTSLDNDPATAEFTLNGNHIGVSVSEIFGNDLQIGLYAYYLYQQATGENSLRTATLTWHEWLAEATLRLQVSNYWAIFVGGGFIGLDVDRQVRGDINETVRMKHTDDTQARIGAEIFTAPGDRIRLTLNRGAAEGLELTFTHAF